MSIPFFAKLGPATGAALTPNIIFLFMPIAHSSFINLLTGLPWEKLIRYHRCPEPLLWALGSLAASVVASGAALAAACGAPPLAGAPKKCLSLDQACKGIKTLQAGGRRWLGHGTLWMVTAHGLSYYIYWAQENT